MPTYRLESQAPFNREKCEILLKTQVESALQDFTYSSPEAEALTIRLSETIMAKVKDFNFDRWVVSQRLKKTNKMRHLFLPHCRYKFIVIVTIGERNMQGYCEMYRCLWDTKQDNAVVYVYENENVFAVVTLHSFYFNWVVFFCYVGRY